MKNVGCTRTRPTKCPGRQLLHVPTLGNQIFLCCVFLFFYYNLINLLKLPTKTIIGR